MRIGIIAAMPGELKPLVKGWERMPVARGAGVAMWQRVRGGDEVVAVCAGMGAAAVRRAFAAAEFAGTLDMVFSVGWAGALTEDEAASAVMTEIIDAQTGERFLLSGEKPKARVVTTIRVADAEEKRRLREAYGAVAVDMEAATVARLAQMRGIPMGCFKVISDGLGAKLPDISRFIDDGGKLRLGGFLAYVAARPWFWGPLITLGMRSAVAAKKLAQVVETFLAQRLAQNGGVGGE